MVGARTFRFCQKAAPTACARFLAQLTRIIGIRSRLVVIFGRGEKEN